MDAQALSQPVGEVVERLQSLPLEVHALVGLAMIAGLLMWAWGWKVLKPMTVVVSALAGAYTASLIAPSLGIGRDVKIEAIVLAGFAFGALGGLLVYRSAMALGCGVVVGIAAPLVASMLLEAEQPPEGALDQEDQYLRGVEVHGEDDWPDEREDSETRVRNELRELMRHAAEDAALDAAGAHGSELDGDDEIGEGGEEGEEENPALTQMKRFMQAVADEAELQWTRLPERHRFVYGTAAIAGLAVGVLLGLVLPGRAAGAVTSLFGAAVWLPSFVWLSEAWSMPWRGPLARLDGRGWLIVWAVAALAGMILQWQGMRRAKRRKGKSDSEESDG